MSLSKKSNFETDNKHKKHFFREFQKAVNKHMLTALHYKHLHG